ATASTRRAGRRRHPHCSPTDAADRMDPRRRSWWGWGWEDQGLDPDQTAKLARSLSERFGVELTARPAPDLADVVLRAPRVSPPAGAADLCSAEPVGRAGHTLGKSFRDVVRASYGDLAAPPDLVAFPATEGDVVSLLDWCADAGIAAIPYGGGSSVVGGV